MTRTDTRSASPLKWSLLITAPVLVGEVGVVVGDEQVIVFDRGRPVRREGKFNAGADRAAPTVIADEVAIRAPLLARYRCDRRDGRAALEIQQRGVPGVTDLAGEQAEASIASVGIAGVGCVAAPQAGPVALGFETEHPGSRLPAIAELSAGEPPVVPWQPWEQTDRAV